VPTYVFEAPGGVVYEALMSWDECQKHLADNPGHKQLVTSPAIISGVSSKPCDGFRDLLKTMKKKHSRGITRSTINTF